MSDLLTLLDDLDVQPATEVYALMPDMATACGLCTLWNCTDCTHRIAHTSDTGWDFPCPQVTCPDCLIADMHLRARQMQSNQARAAA
ncbi:hypothetical protein [Demequina flava]|uniref:hypothetical protein n=1 Tax=Demequina flava TaxID=1095025 RepID=UPI0007842120|nr:hypothetical protein [Demequina flava]